MAHSVDHPMPSESIEHIVVTVHGIRTFGQWQERLSNLVTGSNAKVEVANFHYGYFSVLAFLFPPFRWLTTRRFRVHLRAVAATYPGKEIDLVSHSFGTHIVGYALYGLGVADRPRIRNVILSGSVLRTSFPWADLINGGVVRRVINDCGTRDNILLLSQLFVLFTGMAGRLGFRGMTGKRFINRYFQGGHSHYFESANGPSDAFMEKHWLPTLAFNSDPIPHDERSGAGPLQGVTHTLLQVADPIKLLVYTGVIFGLLFNFYWLPRLEASASATREEQAKIDRQTALARVYFENRDDIPRAVATLAASVAHTPREGVRTDTQRLLLRYWLQSLDSVDSVIASEQGPSIFRWSMSHYLVAKGQLWSMYPVGIVAGTFLEDKSRIFLVGSDGIARVVKIPSMAIEREIRIPRPLESMSIQTAQAEFDISVFSQVTFDAIDAANAERTNGPAASEPLANPTQDPIDSDAYVLVDDEITQRDLDSTAWQASHTEILDFSTLHYDRASNLVVGFGWTRSHSAGSSSFAMSVFDPDTGQTAMLPFFQISSIGSSCGDFTASVSGVETNVKVRLRQRGQLRLLNLSAEERTGKPSLDYQALSVKCEVKANNDGLETSLGFPRLVAESTLWRREDAGKGNVVPDGADEPVEDIQAGHDEKLKQALVEGKAFDGLAIDGEPSGELFSMRFDTGWGVYRFPWDENVVWTRGSDGSKYGALTTCRLERGLATSCLDIRCGGNFCERVESSELRLVALSSWKEFGNDSLYLMDADRVKLLNLVTTPSGAVTDIKFGPNGKLSVLTDHSEMWVYSNLRGTIAVSSMPLVPQNRLYVGQDGTADSEVAQVGMDPIAILDDATVARFDRFDMTPVWLSGNLGLMGKGKLTVVGTEGGFLVVHNDRSLRLLDKETGAFLTRPVSFEDALSRSDDSNLPESFDSVRGFRDGSVLVEFGSMRFRREPPLSQLNLEKRLTMIERFTGISRDGRPLSGLPFRAQHADNVSESVSQPK